MVQRGMKVEPGSTSGNDGDQDSDLFTHYTDFNVAFNPPGCHKDLRRPE